MLTCKQLFKMASNFEPHESDTTSILDRLYQKSHRRKYKKDMNDPKDVHTAELLENIYNKILQGQS